MLCKLSILLNIILGACLYYLMEPTPQVKRFLGIVKTTGAQIRATEARNVAIESGLKEQNGSKSPEEAGDSRSLIQQALDQVNKGIEAIKNLSSTESDVMERKNP